MKVITAPLNWLAGDVLDPGDLDNVWLSTKDALTDVTSRRFAHGFVVLPFVEDVSTPYTQAMTVEELTYRFKCPTTCVLERCFINADMTSAAAVDVTLVDTVGGTPTGATTPLLSTDGATASPTTDPTTGLQVHTTAINVDKVLLTAGTEYLFKVSSIGAFTLNRFDLVLHVVTDRWTVADVPALPTVAITPMTDASFANANTVSVVADNFTTQANKLSANLLAPLPEVFVFHNLTSANGTITFPVPRFDSARAQSRVVRMQMFVVMDNVGNAATITARLNNQAGAAQVTLTQAMAGLTQKSVDSGVVSKSLVNTGSGNVGNAAQDFAVTLSSNAAGAINNVRKVYVYLWVSR